MNPVISNKLQSRLSSVRNETLAPGTGTRHTAVGALVEVYDQEKLTKVTLPVEVNRLVQSYPGLLFAKVRLSSGMIYYLPFRDPEEHIHMLYGNHLLLEGRAVKVEYEGMSVESGVITVQRTFAEKQLDMSIAANTLDFGYII